MRVCLRTSRMLVPHFQTVHLRTHHALCLNLIPAKCLGKHPLQIDDQIQHLANIARRVPCCAVWLFFAVMLCLRRLFNSSGAVSLISGVSRRPCSG